MLDRIRAMSLVSSLKGGSASLETFSIVSMQRSFRNDGMDSGDLYRIREELQLD